MQFFFNSKVMSYSLGFFYTCNWCRKEVMTRKILKVHSTATHHSHHKETSDIVLHSLGTGQIIVQSVMNLPAERGWVSKNLARGPRAQPKGRGAGFYWSTRALLAGSSFLFFQQNAGTIPAVAAAVAAESFTTEKVGKILSTVRDRKKMEDWTAVCWSNKNVLSINLGDINERQPIAHFSLY